jgi:transcriptional regulator with XRE-family HTH domain
VPRKNHYTLESTLGQTVPLAPRHISKQEFGARLQRLMFTKGWNQSELARQAGMRRDAISTYIRGIAFPVPNSLHRLAAALGVDPEALLPNYVEQAVGDAHPSMDIRVSPQRPSEAWLKVDRRVSLTTALTVAKLLNEDEIPD